MNTVEKSGEFLSGEKLSNNIRRVCAGQNVCCAIAFWSDGGVAEVFPAGVPLNVRIVCDISMGATAAEALQALGAPGNGNLRHQLGMHAKVCLSSSGLIVSSANASNAALHSDGGLPFRVEAGTLHAPGSPAWERAAAWFEKLFDKASPIGDNEVKWADLIHNPDRHQISTEAPRQGSLFALVEAAPERFSKIGFVFTATPNEEKDVNKARAYAEKNADSEGSARVRLWPSDDFFTEWKRTEVEEWPGWFIEFWRPEGRRLAVYGRRLEYRWPEIGSIATVRDWPGLRKQVGWGLPSQSQIESNDAEFASQILDGQDKLFTDGKELAKYLRKMPQS